MTLEWLAETVETYLPTGTLDDLVPSVRPEFDALVAQATAWGMQPHVRSVGRTCAEQAEQYKLGYSHADLCRGMHVLGHAADIDLSPNTCATYAKLGAWWESRGGVWGGRWTQFGACGDAGHFHYGFGGAQAVPVSVCPSGVSLAECARVREDYLDAANAGTGVSRGGGLLAGALIIAVGVGLVWAVMRVRPGAMAFRANPSVSSEQVAKHIDATNLHRGGARDAWFGMPVGWDQLSWELTSVAVRDLPEVSPASKRDAKRYAKFGGALPAIVLLKRGQKFVIADGAHRVAAARLQGLQNIQAYVGEVR